MDLHSDQNYALVEKCLGNLRFTVKCDDGLTRTAHLRGSLRKKTRVTPGKFVIVDRRTFESIDNKCDISYVCDEADEKVLKKSGKLEKILKTEEFHGEDEIVEFSVQEDSEEDVDIDNI